MPQSVYAPLSGKEIKEIIKKEICKEIDGVPGLKPALAFKKVHIDVGFNISCYPDDVPCPEGEFSYLIESEETKLGFNENHFAEVDELEAKIVKLRKQHEDLTKLLEEGELALSKVLLTNEVIINEEDTGNPDTLRLKNDLPTPTIQQVGISKQRVEVFSKPIAQANNLKRI